MFLKRNRRRKDGQTYEYWSLVQTVRTAKGPRHRTVCNLGKLPGLDQQHRYGWEDLIDLLEGTEPPPKQQVLGTACTESHKPEWMQVDVKGVTVIATRLIGISSQAVLTLKSVPSWLSVAFDMVIRKSI